jgi:serine/threonine-protein kinase HipA
LGEEAQLSKEFIENVIEQTLSALGKWQSLSKKYGVSDVNMQLISKTISKF